MSARPRYAVPWLQSRSPPASTTRTSSCARSVRPPARSSQSPPPARSARRSPVITLSHTAASLSPVLGPPAPLYDRSVARKAPEDDIGDRDLRVGAPKTTAAGIPGVVAGLAAGVRQ